MAGFEGLGNLMALIGMGLMVGAAGAGSAAGLSIAGASVIGLIKKKPEQFGTGLILSALPASQGLYGFVGYIMYQTKIAEMTTALSIVDGAVALGAGVAMAFACGVSAIYQGKVCANGIAAVGGGHNAFGNTLILAVFPELYAILSLVAAILMLSLIGLVK